MAEKEYIERKAAKDAIFEYICGHTMSKFPSEELLTASKRGAEGALNELDYVPAADVVEVVRCKDCIFGHKDDNYHLGYACEKPLYHPAIGERPHRKLMQDCDYCSHGVRREE